jgi:voltage-gated potassium channel
VLEVSISLPEGRDISDDHEEASYERPLFAGAPAPRDCRKNLSRRVIVHSIADIMAMALRLRSHCRALVNNRNFIAIVFFFILFSSVFILIELALFPPGSYTWVHWINDTIVIVFLLELVIRWIAIGRFRDFIKEYWIDVLAILPLLPFRFLRVMRLLRLLRIITMLVFIRRHLRTFARYFRKKYVPTFLVIGAFLFVLTFCVVAFDHYEMTGQGGELQKLDRSFWTVLYSFCSDQYAPEYPATLEGRFILVFVMFTGLSFFAMLTGTVVSQFSVITDLLREGAILGKHNFKDMENHVVICGWNDYVPIIIGEMQKESHFRNQNFVIISEIDLLPDMTAQCVDMTSVYHVRMDFANARSLENANIIDASIAIVVSDLTRGRTAHDADARSVLTAMTIEKMNPKVYTCVELIHQENNYHLALGKVDNVVLSSSLAAYVIAQSAMQTHVVPLYTELLNPSQGNSFYEVPFPQEHILKHFDEVIPSWKADHNALLIGVVKEDGKVLVNPEGYFISEKDRAMIIARTRPGT